MCTVNGSGIDCVKSMVAVIDSVPSILVGIDCGPSMGGGLG